VTTPPIAPTTSPDPEISGRRLLAVTEEELQRLVLDVHDGPVQHIFASLSQLSLVRARLATVPAAVEVAEPGLGHAVQMLELALLDLRSMLTAFHAPEFADKGVGEIAEDIAVQHETLTGGTIELHIDDGFAHTTVPVIVKIALYRILQEALSNIRRHSGVNDGTVRLTLPTGRLQVQISDAGRGFVPPPLAGPDATERQTHIGLRGMRERAAMVNGSIAVRSSRGEGTQVTVTIPLA
jgi:signal transduction histidine kinase